MKTTVSHFDNVYRIVITSTKKYDMTYEFYCSEQDIRQMQSAIADAIQKRQTDCKVMKRPTKWRARDEYGKWVEGWYAVVHIPEFGNDNGVTGYKAVPHIYNDEPGQRNGCCSWHAIDPATLEPVSEQLTFNFT